MTEQEFYEHIAKNYTEIHKYALKYIKKLSKNDSAWDKQYDCWVPDFDEWDGFDEHIDMNFWVNSEYIGVPEYDSNPHTEMQATAYFYKDGELVSDVYVNICKLEGKK